MGFPRRSFLLAAGLATSGTLGRRGRGRRSDRRTDQSGQSSAVPSGPVPLGGELPIADAEDGLGIEQTTLGSAFTADETPVVSVQSDAQTVHWRLEDYRGELVANGSVAPDADLELPAEEVGYYTLHLRTDADPPTTDRTTLAVLPADPVDHDDPFFGLSTQFDAEQSHGWMEVLERLGVESVREDTGWTAVESTRGEYDFSATDEWVEPLGEFDFERLLVLAYGNGVYDSEDRGYFTMPDSEEYRQGFANFGAETVSHYDGVEHVEVWNEPNLQKFAEDATPEQYAALLEATAAAVREEREDVTVVGGVTAGCCDRWEWWQSMLEAGGAEHADALSIHPYQTPAEGVSENVRRLRDLVRSTTGDAAPPIWVTELGWGTAPWMAGGGRDRWQARYMVRSHAELKAAGVERYFWYTLGDTVYDGDGSPQTDDGSYRMGLVRHPADPLGSDAPKPALVAYAPMARQLAGADLARVESSPEGVVSFASESGDTRVCWADELVDLTVEAGGPVTVTTMLGEERELTPVDGEVYCTVGQDPVYLSGPVEGVSRGAPVELATVETPPNDADRLRGRLSVPEGGGTEDGRTEDGGSERGETTEPRPGSVTVEIAEQTVELTAEPGSEATETLDLPDPYRGRTATVEAGVTADGAQVGRLLTRVGTLYAVLGDPPVFDGLTVDTRNQGEGLVGYSAANDVGTGFSEFQAVSREGRTGWRTDIESGYTAEYLFVDVDDDHLHAVDETVSVTVEYFDEGTGMFNVVYDSHDGDAVSETVDLEDTGSWKTHTFELENARLGDGVYQAVQWHTERPGYDFYVGVGHEDTGWSEQDVTFGSITVGTEPVTDVPPGVDVSDDTGGDDGGDDGTDDGGDDGGEEGDGDGGGGGLGVGGGGGAVQPVDLAVEDVSVSATAVEPGEAVSVTVTLRTVDDRAGSRDLELADGSTVLDETTVMLTPDEERTATFEGSVGERGTHEFEIAGEHVATIEVGSTDDGAATGEGTGDDAGGEGATGTETGDPGPDERSTDGAPGDGGSDADGLPGPGVVGALGALGTGYLLSRRSSGADAGESGGDGTASGAAESGEE